jgi:hypothetical protein
MTRPSATMSRWSGSPRSRRGANGYTRRDPYEGRRSEGRKPKRWRAGRGGACSRWAARRTASSSQVAETPPARRVLSADAGGNSPPARGATDGVEGNRSASSAHGPGAACQGARSARRARRATLRAPFGQFVPSAFAFVLPRVRIELTTHGFSVLPLPGRPVHIVLFCAVCAMIFPILFAIPAVSCRPVSGCAGEFVSNPCPIVRPEP